MDPNANLAEQLEQARAILAIFDDADPDTGALQQLAELEDASPRLAELVIALDEWIRRGGFLPQDWRLSSEGSRTETHRGIDFRSECEGGCGL